MAFAAKPRRGTQAAAVTFVKCALPWHRHTILEAVRRVNFSAAVHLELALTGVPGVQRVALFARPQPLGCAERVEVHVVRLDDVVLDRPLSYVFTLHETERLDTAAPTARTPARSQRASREPVVEFKHPSGVVIWRLVTDGTSAREVRKLERDGTEVFADVDTETFCYRMACPRCERARYSKPNSIHQIELCWVCTKSDRLQRRALSQYRSRRRKK